MRACVRWVPYFVVVVVLGVVERNEMKFYEDSCGVEATGHFTLCETVTFDLNKC